MAFKDSPRVAFFSWTAALGKIPTTVYLWNKGVIIVDWCCMCKRNGESMDHLLLHCPIAFELWTMVWNLFELLWVMTLSVSELLLAWQGHFGKHRNIVFWRVVPHSVMWCIWQEWNVRCFDGCEWSILEIKSLLFHSLLD